MLIRTAAVMFVVCGLALGQSAQQTPQSPLLAHPQLAPVVTASDGAAVSIASQALNAAGGLQTLSAIQDYTGTGEIIYYWAGKQVQGHATLRARGLWQFRLDANLPEGTRSWAVSYGTGKLLTPDGKEKPIPGHDAITLGALTFPGLYLALASSSAGATVSSAGTSEVAGANATVIRVQQHGANDPTGVIARLTSRDFFIDPASGLIIKTEIMTHPTETLTVSLPEDVYFSDYQRVNGVMVPFTITETINGQKVWTIQLSSIQFNTGLGDADFSLP